MPRHSALYAVTTGLSGCYMPDSHHGAFAFGSRAELAAFIRYEIEAQGFPASTFRQASIRDLWRRIARSGSSCAHFRITHGDREIAFHGLTDDEFNAANSED